MRSQLKSIFDIEENAVEQEKLDKVLQNCKSPLPRMQKVKKAQQKFMMKTTT